MGLYRGLLWGLLRGILGVPTMAHMIVSEYPYIGIFRRIGGIVSINGATPKWTRQSYHLDFGGPWKG